jgi:hypothetical protein
MERIAKFTPKDIDAITAAYYCHSDERVLAFARVFRLVPHAEVERVRTQLVIAGHFNPNWGISKPLGEAIYAVLADGAISDHDYVLLTDAVLGHD